MEVTLTIDTAKECQDMIVKLRKEVTEGKYRPNQAMSLAPAARR
jgi:hypothetical protein